LRGVCDGWLVVESLVSDTRLFTGFEQTVPLTEFAPALSSIPIAQFLPVGRFHGDPTNKWVPNLSCLVGLVEDSGFRALRSENRGHRGLVQAEIEVDAEKERMIEMDRGLRDVP
jgi:hypothetical protein